MKDDLSGERFYFVTGIPAGIVSGNVTDGHLISTVSCVYCNSLLNSTDHDVSAVENHRKLMPRIDKVPSDLGSGIGLTTELDRRPG